MSKNLPDDNMYSILGKLAALTPAETSAPEPKTRIYESVAAQGSITAGMSAVESKLMEKYMGFEKLEKSLAARGDVKDPGAVAASIGRKKYGKAKFQKAAAKGHKLGEQNMGPGTGGMEEDTMMEKAPPGMEDMVLKLKKQYPGHPEKAFATAWMIYNKKHGKTEEASEITEENCMECGMCESECECSMMEALPEPRLVKGKGPYGSDYRHDDEKELDLDDFDDEDRKPKKRGRPNGSGGTKTGARSNGDSKLASGQPGRRSAVRESLGAELNRIGSRLLEGINFAEMMKETHQTADELLAELQDHIKTFKETGHCSDKLQDFLNVHKHAKRIADEAIETPAEKAQRIKMMTPAVKRPGNPLSLGDVADRRSHPDYYEKTAHQHNLGIHDELDELAKLAGIPVDEADMEEGAGVMHYKAEKAKEAGKDTFTMGDKEFPVKEDEHECECDTLGQHECPVHCDEPPHDVDAHNPADVRESRGDVCPECESDPCECDDKLDEVAAIAKLAGLAESQGELCKKCHEDPCECGPEVDEGNEFTGELAKAKAAHKKEFEVDGKTYPVKESLMSMMMPDAEADNLSLNSSYNSADDRRSVTVTAQGDKAKELMQLLKLSGLVPFGHEESKADHEMHAEPEHHEVEIIAAEPESHQEVEEEYANEPDPKYQSMKGSTMGPGEGDFGEKDMYGGAGDNPMTPQPDRPARPVRNVTTLEAKLAREYESIKKRP